MKTHTLVVGYRWICLDEPVLLTEPKQLLTEFYINQRVERFRITIFQVLRKGNGECLVAMDKSLMGTSAAE